MNHVTHPAMSPYLVTGATGLSGTIILKELFRQNIPVRALVRDRARAAELERYPNVALFEGDMLKPDTLQAALAGVEKAILISSAFEDLVKTQQTFIDTAIRAGVQHLIKYSGAESGIGFSAQNFQPTRQHEQVEDYLVNAGVNWTILRPSQFMEVYLPGSVTGVNLRQNALVLPVERAKLAPVSIADVAKVCARLLTQTGHEGKIYEMTGPDAMTMPEASEIISEALGKEIAFIPVEMETYRQGLLQAGVPDEIAGHLIDLCRERRKCTASHIKLDTHKLFGVRPTNFAQFIYQNRPAFTVS